MGRSVSVRPEHVWREAGPFGFRLDPVVDILWEVLDVWTGNRPIAFSDISG
jgi:hypothetical protein